MMGRRFFTAAVLVTVAVLTSSCSLREVQLWFAFNRHQSISRDQAKNIADLVNSKRAAGGCDANYAGGCVPDNATQVHCAGAAGEGPAVRGLLTVTGWDSFELDPDGDKHACDSPVGAFDLFGQVGSEIRISGWAFDPNTADPIQLALSVDGYVEQLVADGSRQDLAAALPGVGLRHGFEFSTWTDPNGAASAICVVAINVGTGSNTTLGCKTIIPKVLTDVDLDPMSDPTGDVVSAVLEGADVVPGGIRVRGFAFDRQHRPRVAAISFHLINAAGPETATWVGQTPAIVRSDINTAFGLASDAASGFDWVIPTPPVTASTTKVCMFLTGNAIAGVNCRDVNT